MSMCQHCGALPNEWHPSWCPNSGTTPTARPETTPVSETPGDGRNEAVAPPEGGRVVAWADVLGAVARGWCTQHNAHKVMDAVLAEAIAEEVMRLYASPSGAAGLLRRIVNKCRAVLVKERGHICGATVEIDAIRQMCDAFLKEPGNDAPPVGRLWFHPESDSFVIAAEQPDPLCHEVELSEITFAGNDAAVVLPQGEKK